jgi:hypothetical protein
MCNGAFGYAGKTGGKVAKAISAQQLLQVFKFRASDAYIFTVFLRLGQRTEPVADHKNAERHRRKYDRIPIPFGDSQPHVPKPPD